MRDSADSSLRYSDTLDAVWIGRGYNKHYTIRIYAYVAKNIHSPTRDSASLAGSAFKFDGTTSVADACEAVSGVTTTE